jgi:DsbC/DsbD-like thiol-disulfide interchange protein
MMLRHAKSLAILPLLLSGGLPAAAPGATKPAGDPAKLVVTVNPLKATPGQAVEVVVRVEPNPGIKVNRYPKMKLQVPASAGLVSEAEVSVGASEMPPIEQPEANYYKTVDPVALKVQLDPKAPKGAHKVQARFTYYYCVAASGFCAPERTSITIPLDVR